ncbi:hypothetical protein [Wolbachia pipientis]
MLIVTEKKFNIQLSSKKYFSTYTQLPTKERFIQEDNIQDGQNKKSKLQ